MMQRLRRTLRPQHSVAAHGGFAGASVSTFSGFESQLRNPGRHREAFARLCDQASILLLDPYLPGLRPTLEAQLIDLADEIAYNAADLDDAYEAGLLTTDRIAARSSGLCGDP